MGTADKRRTRVQQIRMTPDMYEEVHTITMELCYRGHLISKNQWLFEAIERAIALERKKHPDLPRPDYRMKKRGPLLLPHDDDDDTKGAP